MPFTSDDHLVLRFSSQRDRQEIAICENQRKCVQSPHACSMMIITHLDEVAVIVLERHRSVHRLLHTHSLWTQKAANVRIRRGVLWAARPAVVTRPDIRRGRAVHSIYAPGMPLPPGCGKRVAGPARGVMITSRERTYRVKATILDFAQPH